MLARTLKIALLAALLLCSHAWAAELSTESLGNDGELFALVAGSYGTLFPDVSDLAAETRVLALETTLPDGTLERQLIPGTTGVGTPTGLLYDRTFGTVTAIWQTDDGSLLNIASLFNDEWTTVASIEDPNTNAVSVPKILAERDRFELQVTPDQWLTVERQILHAAWTAVDADGVLDVRYSPLAFVDGHFIGSHDVYSVRDITGEKVEFAPLATDDLTNAFELSKGAGGEIFLTFVNANDSQLTVAQVGVVPLAVLHFADEIRAALLDLEADFSTLDLDDFSERARVQLIVTGRRHRDRLGQTASYVASEVQREILSTAASFDSYSAMVDHLFGFTLSAAAPLVTANVSVGEDGVPEIHVGNLLDQSGWTPLVNVTTRRELPVPPITGANVKFLTSSDGRNVLAAWENGEAMSYLESMGDGWSAELQIELQGDHALQILTRRVR